MTDMPNPAKPRQSLLKPDARTVKRNRAEARFKAYGIAAIAVGLLMLAILLTTIIGRGAGAFQQTFLTLNVQLLEAKLDKNGNRDIEEIKKVSTFGYAPLMAAALEAKVAEAGITTDLKPKEMGAIISKDAAAQLRDFVLANPEPVSYTHLTLPTIYSV